VKEPRWLLRETVLAVQAWLVHEHGGLAGLRDQGLLDSALARPRNLFAYQAPDLFTLAAAYAGGIVQDHPFLDGNKRTAFLVAYTFLSENGWNLETPETEIVSHMISLASRRETEEQFAAWLRASSIRSRRVTKKRARPGKKPKPRRRGRG
jgi:death-on-curing protein